jgi:hypothetical protein
VAKIAETEEEQTALGVSQEDVNFLVNALMTGGEQITGSNYTIMLNAFLKCAALVIVNATDMDTLEVAESVLRRLVVAMREANMKAAN